MLQRIQSVFLFLASASVFSLELPKVGFMSLIHGIPQAGSPYSDSIFNILDDRYLMVLTAVAGIGFLTTMLSYKNRKTQILAAMMGSFLVAMDLIYGTWEARETFAKTVSAEPTYDGSNLQSNFGYAIPALVVALVFSLLAIRFIRRDEKLVRSADRLR